MAKFIWGPKKIEFDWGCQNLDQACAMAMRYAQAKAGRNVDGSYSAIPDFTPLTDSFCVKFVSYTLSTSRGRQRNEGEYRYEYYFEAWVERELGRKRNG